MTNVQSQLPFYERHEPMRLTGSCLFVFGSAFSLIGALYCAIRGGRRWRATQFAAGMIGFWSVGSWLVNRNYWLDPTFKPECEKPAEVSMEVWDQRRDLQLAIWSEGPLSAISCPQLKALCPPGSDGVPVELWNRVIDDLIAGCTRFANLTPSIAQAFRRAETDRNEAASKLEVARRAADAARDAAVEEAEAELAGPDPDAYLHYIAAYNAAYPEKRQGEVDREAKRLETEIAQAWQEYLRRAESNPSTMDQALSAHHQLKTQLTNLLVGQQTAVSLAQKNHDKLAQACSEAEAAWKPLETDYLAKKAAVEAKKTTAERVHQAAHEAARQAHERAWAQASTTLKEHLNRMRSK